MSDKVGFKKKDEQVYTDQYSDDTRDLDNILEFSTVMNTPSMEISVIEKDADQDEEQKGTPLADINDTDFSNGKKFKLPCTDKQLEKMLRDIGIDGIATTESSCMVKVTNAKCPALCGMVVDSPNFHELNFLAKCLKKMPTEELSKFNKIVEYERQLNPHMTPADAINISYNLDNYKLYDVSGAKTVEEQMGKLKSQLDKGVEGEPEGGFVKNTFVSKLGENQAVYQSADDIEKLSGFVNAIKSGLGLK